MKILVTAGPTREPIDPVRFISNRSSGRMGYALAAAAKARGHEVVLVSGPVSLLPVPGVKVVTVVTAEDMRRAVARQLPPCDALIMAAAVCDWRPARAAKHKLKKRIGLPRFELRPTPDILQSIRPLKGDRLVIGFAAETDRLVAEARRKLKEKNLDLIVANDVSRADSGFETDTNRVVMIAPDYALALPLMSKRAVAERIVRWLESRSASSVSRTGNKKIKKSADKR